MRYTKSTYGLKQSGRLWAETLANAFAACGLKRSAADPCMWYYHGKDGAMALCTHVDDILIAPSNAKFLENKMREIYEHAARFWIRSGWGGETSSKPPHF